MVLLGSDNNINSKNLKNILFEVLKQVDIDPTRVETQVKDVLSSEIKYIPIRHNSPGSAILVKRSIEKYRPKLILIEGPALADNLIPYMIEDDTKPPFAILSIFADEKNVFEMNGILSPDDSIPAKFQVHYPFIAYSPELVALVEAKRKLIPVNFIDLPLTGLIPYMIREEENFTHILKQEEDQMNSSKFYNKLSQIFQYDNFNETWDSLFEIGTNRAEIEDLRECLLVFCACVRETIPEKMLEITGTFSREQYMKYKIINLMNKYGVDEKKVFVITGGLHSVFLHKKKKKNVKFTANGLYNSLVPYSYYRISDQSGYGSGNQGPRYYNYIWDKFQEGIKYSFVSTALELIIDIFRDARIRGHVISISDSINSFQSAKMLAMMRRRAEPSLKDVVDSIYMSTVKGNPDIEGAYLNSLLKKRIVGFKVGKITKKIGKLPLQEDFYLRFEIFDIQLKETDQSFTLNLRDDRDQKISYLFFRIKYLGIEILEKRRGPDLLKGVTGIFKEVWVLIWNPRVDTKLIELNIYGSTIEDASKGKLIEEIQRQIKDFEKVSYLLYQTLVMGLPNLLPHVYDVCNESLEKDDLFTTLSRGFNNLIMIYRFLSMLGNQENNLSIVEKLVKRNYYASCFSLPNLANPPDDLNEAFVLATRDMATTLIAISEIELDRNVFEDSLKICIEKSVNDFIKGCCVGLLYLINSITIEELKQEITEYINSEDSIKMKVGEFIRGIIFECQTKILFNTDIIKLLTELVENLDWNIFTAIVPSLRKTFATLKPREYDVFVEKIAEVYGLKVSTIKELKSEIDDQYLIFFMEINKKVRKIFEKWFGEV